MTLKEEMNEWIVKYLTKGNKMVKYSCPLCDGDCYCVILDEDQVHDSLSTCPECEKTHFRITRNHDVEVSIPGQHVKSVETEVIDKNSY